MLHLFGRSGRVGGPIFFGEHVYEDFQYVDFWQKGKDSWRRASIAGPQGIITHKAALRQLEDVYMSVQLYSKQFHEEGEMQICPVFFDLDGDESLMETLREAQELSTFLYECGVPYEQQRWNFSGRRGFHCVVNFRCYQAEPAIDAHEVVKKLALHVKDLLGLKTLDDKVYSARRVLRIPGTKHSGSGLYAIPLETSRLHETVHPEVLLSAAKQGEPAPEWRFVADNIVCDEARSWVGIFCGAARGEQASPKELAEERDRAENHWWRRCTSLHERRPKFGSPSTRYA